MCSFAQIWLKCEMRIRMNKINSTVGYSSHKYEITIVKFVWNIKRVQRNSKATATKWWTSRYHHKFFIRTFIYHMGKSTPLASLHVYVHFVQIYKLFLFTWKKKLKANVFYINQSWFQFQKSNCVKFFFCYIELLILLESSLVIITENWELVFEVIIVFRK